MSALTGNIEELMTPRFVERLSAQSGIPDAKVRSGMTGAVASILDGLAGKARDPHAMGQFADLVRNTPATDAPEQLLGDDMAMQRHSTQLLGLVGGDSQSLATRIGRYLGVGGKAATGMVAAASTLVIGAFRKLAKARGGLDASALSSTLIADQREIHAAVPAGIMNGEARAKEVVERTPARERTETVTHRLEGERVRPASTSRWLIPLLLFVAALIALWLLGRSRTHKVEAPAPQTPAPSEHAAPTPAPTPPTRENAAPTERQPGETSGLSFPAGSPEAKLVTELKGTGTGNAIDLDNIRFDADKATLAAGSKLEIASLAKVLSAYPTARVRISATGTEQNQTLAQARADAVRQALVAQGVDGARIEARGEQGAGQEAADHATIQVLSQ
jgi:outer membrane protein OmpA-like peptidoglycan-associated protein